MTDGREVGKEERLFKVKIKIGNKGLSTTSPYSYCTSFLFSLFLYLCPFNSVVCRKDCEEQNPVDKLRWKPYASQGERGLSQSVNSVVCIPTLF